MIHTVDMTGTRYNNINNDVHLRSVGARNQSACRSACIILTECNHLAAAQNSVTYSDTEDMRVCNQRPLPQNQNKGYTIHEDTPAPAPQKSGNPILVWNSTANYQAISISMHVVTAVAIAWRIFCWKFFFFATVQLFILWQIPFTLK